MGMFDWVNYEAPCVKCGTLLDKKQFQSKDSRCFMDLIEPWQVQQFYASCPQCQTWNEYHVTLQAQPVVIAPPHKIEFVPEATEYWRDVMARSSEVEPAPHKSADAASNAAGPTKV